MNTYLVYQLGEQEMGSEGWSDRYNFTIVEAETEDEAIRKWHNEKCVDTELCKKGDKWFCYYQVVANKLPKNHYGRVEKLKIVDCWDACIDDKNGGYHYGQKEEVC